MTSTKSRILKPSTDSIYAPSPLKMHRVSFADDHGQELVQVQTIPTFDHHYANVIAFQMAFVRPQHIADETEVQSASSTWQSIQQTPDLQLMQRQGVYLLSAQVEPMEQPKHRRIAGLPSVESLHLSGTIQVLNAHFDKSVRVRYSTDGWRTQHDVDAHFKRTHGCRYDIFSFHATIQQQQQQQPNRNRQLLDLADGSQGLMMVDENRQQPTPRLVDEIQLAISYACGAKSARSLYWDNNNRLNYRLKRDPPLKTAGGKAAQNKIPSCTYNFLQELNDVVLF